jgi:hypothetical protein
MRRVPRFRGGGICHKRASRSLWSRAGIGGLRFRAARVSKRIQLQQKTPGFLEESRPSSLEAPGGCAKSAQNLGSEMVLNSLGVE